MLQENTLKNSLNLLPESFFENTPYIRADFKRRREVLRETIDLIKDKYVHLYSQAHINLELWSKQSQENISGLNSKLNIGVYSGDWGRITQQLTKEYGNCFAVLNMANAYVPGGAYLEGLIAQEENMFRRTDCHFSIKRNYLGNDNHYKQEWVDLINGVNGSVYLDKENPRICVRDNEIIDQEDLGYEWLSEDNIFPFYEMRSAAVDLRFGIQFCEDECIKRIRAQFNTLVNANVRYVVLGAHGCGAFLNPTEKVAEIYAKVIKEYQNDFHNISFAIYNAGYGPDNYTPFAKQFSDSSNNV